MKKLTIIAIGLGLVLLMVGTGIVLARQTQRPSGGLANTGFTYQGQLVLNGAPVTGACTFRFDLFDVPVGGAALGMVTQTNVPVAGGLFTVILDFGFAPFDGNARYLEIAVDCGGGLTVLAPRQKLEAVPYAVHSGATRWGGLLDKPAGFADDVDNDTQYSAGTGLVLIGTTFSPNFNFVQRRVIGACVAGSSIRVVAIDGTVTCETDDVGSGGGSGTVTSLTAGPGIILSPTPITTTGQISSTLGTSITTAEIADGAVTNTKLSLSQKSPPLDLHYARQSGFRRTPE